MFECMSRTTTCLLLALMLFVFPAFPQAGYVFVKKKGIKKKIQYQPGDEINLRLKYGAGISGRITFLNRDTIYINNMAVPKTDIGFVLLKRKPKKPFPDAKTITLIAGGSALTSLGLYISDRDNATEALIAGPVIGFGPLLIKHFGGRIFRLIPKARYKIGRRYHLQIIDLPLPQRRR